MARNKAKIEEEKEYLVRVDKLPLDDKDKNVIRRWITEDRRCLRCGGLFREIDNFGTWRCIHTVFSGPKSMTTRVPCDHIAHKKEWQLTDSVVMRADLCNALNMKVLPAAVITIPEDVVPYVFASPKAFKRAALEGKIVIAREHWARKRIADYRRYYLGQRQAAQEKRTRAASVAASGGITEAPSHLAEADQGMAYRDAMARRQAVLERAQGRSGAYRTRPSGRAVVKKDNHLRGVSGISYDSKSMF